MNWTLLQNSLLVSALTTAAALALGFLASLWLAAVATRLRRWLLALTVVAFALPPFLVANCWMYFFGNSGVWRGWLTWNVHSLGGTVWILTLLNWPIAVFFTLGAWSRLQPSQLESDPALAGWPLIRWLLLPMAKPGLGLAGVLTFVLAMNNFAVPSILQTKVYPAELWVSFNTTFDYAAALKLSWPMLTAPLILLWWFLRCGTAWPQIERRVQLRLLRQQLGAGWLWTGATTTILLLAISVGLPLSQLIGTGETWRQLAPAFRAGQSAFWHSIAFAAATASLCGVLALGLWKWRFGPLLWLPFFVPGVLLGIALIYLLNRPVWDGVLHSLGIVVVGFAARYLVVAWSSAARAGQAVDSSLTEAARLEGAGAWRILRDVHWPQIASPMTAAWYVTYVLCLWDVETLIFIVPPGAETLSLRIFNLLHYGWNNQVNALCLLLLGAALLPWLVWQFGAMARRRPRVLAAPALFGLVVLTACSPTTANETPIQSRNFGQVQIIGSRGTVLGQFNKPRSLAVDARDNLYVVDMTGRVQKFSSNGVFLASWQMPQTDKGKPKGMGRDSAGNVIVVEPHYSRVNHFSPDGRLLTQWGHPGTNDGELSVPRSVAVNSRHEIFVTEYTAVERVQAFSELGRKWLFSFGKYGAELGEFNRAEGIGVDAHDLIYVADSCNHRIQIFSPEGRFLRAYGRAGSGLGELSYPYDVQIDRNGRQFVCEFGNSRIQVFDAQDQPVEIIGGPGSAPGQFDNPWALALDSAGNLYVADSMNHRVQKLIRRKP